MDFFVLISQYRNSILQCLFNTPGLADYFLQGTHKKEKNPRNKGLADAFAELLGKIKSHAGAPSHSAESTHDVKNRICKNILWIQKTHKDDSSN